MAMMARVIMMVFVVVCVPASGTALGSALLYYSIDRHRLFFCLACGMMP